MPADFAYMTSSKNLRPIMERIGSAGSPPKFTLEFLKSLGFTSSTDRPVINVLKTLGFLSVDSIPTDRYNAYRDANRRGRVLADGLREGWAQLFLVDQQAHQKTPSQLTESFKSVSGKGEAVSKKMATTFKTLADMADWGQPAAQPEPDAPQEETRDLVTPVAQERRTSAKLALHHDVHIHLPSTSDVSVYTAIFRALKAELLD